MKRKAFGTLVALVTLSVVGTQISSSGASSSGETFLYQKGNFSNTYTEIPKSNPGRAWRDGMVSGNGENGFIASGSPYSDALIYQYMFFNFPSNQPRYTPSILTSQLSSARQAVLALNDKWKVTEEDGSTRNRTFYYSYHPGHQLRLNMAKSYTTSDYERWTNYETAEVGVRYTDEKGEWVRTSFTSRMDNVSITKITKSSTGNKINMTVSIDDISSMYKAYDGMSQVKSLKYKKLVDKDANYIAQVAHYPSYDSSELKDGGYAGVTQVIVVNGTKEKVLLDNTNESMNVGEEQNPAIDIKNADAVYLITQSNRTSDMGDIKNFASENNYELVDKLYTNTNSVAKKYNDSDGNFDYYAALTPHKKLQSKEFNAVNLSLDGDKEDKDLSNEELISKQQSSTALNQSFMKHVYDQGRYAQICCSGSSAPRLSGMWTGEWNPGWRSIYTLDANVNLQVSAMNTGNLLESPLGYINFILRNAPDWEYNASMAYGMKDAIQTSVNSDGDNGKHVEYDNSYPFQYWNAGASWCLLPIYEYWQCYGNQKIKITDEMRIDNLKSILSVENNDLTDNELKAIKDRGYLDLEKDILLPLLTKQANFWQQICTPEYYVDANGKACYKEGKKSLTGNEKYLIIPTYSPENNPIGYSSTITANATMDISAARDGLKMTIAMENAVKRSNYKSYVSKWENLMSLLPNYQYDEKGNNALREWAITDYTENNNHRHLSHLYAAWPAYETQDDTKLAVAAKQALSNRKSGNTSDSTAGHGWMHQALVETRLKDGNSAVNSMLKMMNGSAYYKSLMTDHDTNRRNDTYCTDTLLGTLGVVNEMLVYSNTGTIQVLPALPDKWTSGSITGIMARTQAEVKNLSWNTSKGLVTVKIKSNIDQTINLTSGIKWSQATISKTENAKITNGKSIELTMKKDDEITVNFYTEVGTLSDLKNVITEAQSKLDKRPATDILYNKSANTKLSIAISNATTVYDKGNQSDFITTSTAIYDLREAIKEFDEAYEYSLKISLPSGIYSGTKNISLKYKDNSNFEVHYTIDDSEPTLKSPKYTSTIHLPMGITHFKAAQFETTSGTKVVETVSADYQCNSTVNLSKGNNATIDRPIYNNMGADLAIDGNDTTRLAVNGKFSDYTLTVNLGSIQPINNISIDEYVEGSANQVKRITDYKLLYSEDGTTYKEIGTYSDSKTTSNQLQLRPSATSGNYHAYYGMEFNEVKAKYIKLVMNATTEISIWEFGIYNDVE